MLKWLEWCLGYDEPFIGLVLEEFIFKITIKKYNLTFLDKETHSPVIWTGP